MGAQVEADKLTAAHAALQQKFAELQRCVGSVRLPCVLSRIELRRRQNEQLAVPEIERAAPGRFAAVLCRWALVVHRASASVLSQLQKLSAEYTSIVNAAKPLLQRLDEVPSAVARAQRCVRARRRMRPPTRTG